MCCIRAGLAALAVWVSFVPMADACSTPGDYVPPSDYELVLMADAIVVATATGGTPSGLKDNHLAESHVRFRVDSILKGSPPREFDNEGFELIDPNNNGDQEFYGGMCGRSGFTRGKTYVVALRKTTDGDGWAEAAYLFGRSSEDYLGSADPWIKTIRDFLDIQTRFASREQYDALRQLATRLGKQRRNEAIRAEIDAIERHLGTRSEYKPSWYLVETYEQLERGEALQWPWAPREYWLPDPMPPPVDQQMASVLGFLTEGDHPEAAAFFERQLTKPKPSVFELAAGIKYVAKSGEMRRAFDLINTRVAPLLAAYSLPEAMTLISASGQAMNGGAPWDKPDWKNDPYVTERWPIMAFGFRRYVEEVAGLEWSAMFDLETEALKPADFRDWPEWTLTQARYDDEVQSWAAAELTDDTLLNEHLAALSRWDPDSYTQPPEDPAILPMRVIVRSYRGPRSDVMITAFCQGPERRLLLINMLGAEAQTFDDDGLFESMLATPSLTADERMAISTSLAELIGAIQARNRAGLHGDRTALKIWSDLLAVAMTDRQPAANPISCSVN